VNLLQDAVEAFLVAVADSVSASLEERTFFDKYFVLINEKIKPKELPFKNRLLRLNRIRVDSKHHGIQPERDEIQRLAISVREFFEEVSSSILDANFATISAIDLLEEGETKEILLMAKSALERGDHSECSISCRKAIYLELEKEYDIFDFKEGDKKPGQALGPYSRAPFYAQRKEYIEKRVMDPTDYIVYDHSDLDQELLKNGVDNTTFWNIWRLTPEIYRTKEKQWVVKYDLAKLDTDFLGNNIEYIFNATLDVVLAIHIKRGAFKYSSDIRHYIELKQEEVPVYEKADMTSKVAFTTPKNLTKLDCSYYITGLQGDGPYWYVLNLEPLLYGFIHNDNVKRNE
jgi:hypothetical protein